VYARLAQSLALLAVLSACREQPIVGTWSGQDEGGAVVVYEFRPDGAGSRRSAGGPPEAFQYEFAAGYPNLISVTFPSPNGLAVRRGLVEIGKSGSIRIELAPAGQPAPSQLGGEALTLWKPGTK
jgi:hypothetical protein